MRRVAALALVAVAFGNAGCTPVQSALAEARRAPSSATALIVTHGRRFAEVAEPVGVVLRRVDGESLSMLQVGNPFTRVLPDGATEIGGTLETSRKVTFGPPGTAPWRQQPFTLRMRLEPGWLYLLEPGLEGTALHAEMRRLCPSPDHDATIRALLAQDVFARGRLDAPIRCPLPPPPR